MKLTSSLSLLALLLLCGAERALPAVLAPTTLTLCDTNGGTPLHAESATDCSLPGTLGASASVSGSPFILLTAAANSPGPSAFISASGDARLDYQFQVVGGTAGTSVNVRIDLLMETFADHNLGLGFATFDLLLPTGAGYANAVACTPAGQGGCPVSAPSMVDTTITRSIVTGVAYTIRLRALARAGSNPTQGGAARSGWATIDPYIYIDPTTPNASLYSVEVSPGIANVPASVPEPATASLLALGGLFAAWLRRRRC